ncbi:MAG TPA: hypothetical protein VGB45_06865, partial [Abditibacterium sp.]
NNKENATFKKTNGNSADRTLLYWPINNAGVVSASGGNLWLNGGGNSSGSFVSQNSGKVDFTSGTHTLSEGTRIGGNGTTVVSAAKLIANGRIDIGSATEASILMLQNGTLDGTGIYTLGGKSRLRWSGGTLRNLLVGPTSVLVTEGTGAKYGFESGIVRNFGIINFGGSGPFYSYDRSSAINQPFSIINELGALFDVQKDGRLFSTINADGTFNNKRGATFRVSNTLAKTVNTGGWSFVNAGTISNNKILDFSNGSTLNGGGLLSGTGRTRLSSGTHLLNGVSTVTGGIVDFYEGTFKANGGLKTTGTGAVVWSGGTLGGKFELIAGSQMRLQPRSSLYLQEGAVLTNSGTLEAMPFTTSNFLYSLNTSDSTDAVATLLNKAGAVLKSRAAFGLSSIGARGLISNAGQIEIGAAGSGSDLTSKWTLGGWDFTQISTGTLNIDTNSAAEGSFDTLQSAGKISLSGTLNVRRLATYLPAENVVLKIISGVTRSGSFSKTVGVSPYPGFLPQYNSDNFSLLGRGSYTLSVKLVDEANLPISGANVTLAGAMAKTMASNASGLAVFTALPGGTFTVSVAAPAGSFWTPATQNINLPLSSSQPNGTLTFKLARSITLSGTAVRYAWNGTAFVATPVLGAVVTLKQGETTIKATKTIENGTYALADLRPGTYTATIARSGMTFAPSTVSLTLKSSVPSVAANFTTRDIVAQITNSAGQPVSGVKITVSGAASAAPLTNTNGQILLASQGQGSFTLTPSKTGATFTPSSLSISVTASNIATVSSLARFQIVLPAASAAPLSKDIAPSPEVDPAPPLLPEAPSSEEEISDEPVPTATPQPSPSPSVLPKPSAPRS